VSGNGSGSGLLLVEGTDKIFDLTRMPSIGWDERKRETAFINAFTADLLDIELVTKSVFYRYIPSSGNRIIAKHNNRTVQ
jgi:hypothetical protein